MIRISAEIGQVRIIQSLEELPDLSGAKELFLDVETTSFDDNEDGYFPYNGNRNAGIAVTVDEDDFAFYVPYRHRNGTGPAKGNLPIEGVQKWIQSGLPTGADWINSNVKFDAHFMRQDGYEHLGRMIDTIVLSKLINSDRLGYGLKGICRDWLGLDMEDVDKVKAYLEQIGKGNRKCKDYGRLPIDLCGEYAGMDVLSNRQLYRHLCWRRPEQIEGIWETEIQLTPVLYDMECEGMFGNRTQIMVESVHSLTRILEVHDRIAELTGCEYTDSNVHLFDLLCNQCGLPAIGWTDEGNVSFNKDVLRAYTIHPQVVGDPAIKELIDLIIEERGESHFKSLFLDSYLKFMDEDGFIHPSFNQLVRTGRMSCRQPNAQQLNRRAKHLILPPPGFGILRADASQIEFRMIAHYLNDEMMIQAYNDDPWTDFHQWTADQSGVRRPAGKILNFAMGFGAGRKLVNSQLVNDPDIMEEVGAIVAALVGDEKIDPSAADSEYRRLCGMKADSAYDAYHMRLPNLKKISRVASLRCRKNGFVFNAFGRRRHLPANVARKAFNTVIQGCAMDYIKTRMNALAPRYNKRIREWGMKPFVNVHDELAWYIQSGLLAAEPEVLPYVNEVLCYQTVPFRIPFVWDLGFSEKSWAEASGDNVLHNEDGQYIGGPLDRIVA